MESLTSSLLTPPASVEPHDDETPTVRFQSDSGLVEAINNVAGDILVVTGMSQLLKRLYILIK